MSDFLTLLNQNQRGAQPSFFPSQSSQPQSNPFNSNNNPIQPHSNNAFNNVSQQNQFSSNQSVLIPQNLSSLLPNNNNINTTSSNSNSYNNTVIAGQGYDSAYDQSINYLHNKEVFNVLQSFLISLDSKNPANVFKYMIYNGIPDNFKKTIQASIFKRYYPYQKNSDGSFNCIDYLLWQKALKFNPNQDTYYPIQLSSSGQLKQRAEKDEQVQLALLKTLKMAKEIIEKSKSTYDSSINNELGLIKQKRNLIKMKMCSICKQISSIAVLKGKAKKDVEIENNIANKLKELRKSLDDKGELMVKMNNIASCPIDVFHPIDQFSDEQTKMSEERLMKTSKALNDLRSLVYFASGSIQKNIIIAQGIQDDLEYLKSNGCFKDK